MPAPAPEGASAPGREVAQLAALADLAFDRGAGAFPWRHAWLAETFSHGILKLGLTAAGVLASGAAAVELIRARGQRRGGGCVCRSLHRRRCWCRWSPARSSTKASPSLRPPGEVSA